MTKRTIGYWLILTSLVYPQGPGNFIVQPSSKRDSSVQALTLTSSSALSVRLMELDAIHINGKTGKGTICIYFDPSRGLYLWEFLMWPAGFPILPSQSTFMSKSKIFVANDQIVHFKDGSYIHSTGKASNLDDAEKKSMEEATGILHKGESAIVFSRKPFPWRFPPDFRIPEGSAIGVSPQIMDVQMKNSQWLVTVQGVWKEIVTLDANFDLVAHSPAPGEKAKYWIKNLPPSKWGNTR